VPRSSGEAGTEGAEAEPRPGGYRGGVITPADAIRRSTLSRYFGETSRQVRFPLFVIGRSVSSQRTFSRCSHIAGRHLVARSAGGLRISNAYIPLGGMPWRASSQKFIAPTGHPVQIDTMSSCTG